MKKRFVVLTGAGISAESGLRTFRDSDGLWEGYEISQVATPEAWSKDPELVQRFYNERRKGVLEAKPNAAHYALAELEQDYDVVIVTQNIDDLHERAGSSSVVHLHGEIKRSCSSTDRSKSYEIRGWELKMGETCELGSQLRPDIVWFGEPVPMMEEAISITQSADLFAVIGTSLVVYPAAGLVDFVPQHAKQFLVDPKIPAMVDRSRVQCFQDTATAGVPKMVAALAA